MKVTNMNNRPISTNEARSNGAQSSYDRTKLHTRRHTIRRIYSQYIVFKSGAIAECAIAVTTDQYKIIKTYAKLTKRVFDEEQRCYYTEYASKRTEVKYSHSGFWKEIEDIKTVKKAESKKVKKEKAQDTINTIDALDTAINFGDIESLM